MKKNKINKNSLICPILFKQAIETGIGFGGQNKSFLCPIGETVCQEQEDQHILEQEKK